MKAVFFRNESVSLRIHPSGKELEGVWIVQDTPRTEFDTGGGTVSSWWPSIDSALEGIEQGHVTLCFQLQKLRDLDVSGNRLDWTETKVEVGVLEEVT